MNKISLILADDHTIMRDGLVGLLEKDPDTFVIGTASNGLELIDLASERNPDVIISDISMPKLNGLEAAEEILKINKTARILFLTMHDGDEDVYNAAKTGARGLVNKNTNIGEVQLAINTISEGKTYFHGKWKGMSPMEIVQKYEKAHGTAIEFNYRETQVLELLAKGNTSQQMAEELKLSKKSIDFYRAQLRKKTKVESPADLVIYAKKWAEKKSHDK